MTILVVPTPHHGDKQTTKKGNMLICLYIGTSRKFFYLSPEGLYRPHKFTKKHDQLLTKTEWNFLYEKTREVEHLSLTELLMAEELFPYILKRPTIPWDIANVRETTGRLAKS